MSYSDVISLIDAKAYLKVDDTATDTEINRMIKSSLSYLEKHTNILVYDREVTYPIPDSCIRMYDHPINSVVKGIDKDAADVALVFEDDYDQTLHTNYTFFDNINGDAKQLVLNVGYDDPGQVPPEMIDAALEMIDYWFYKNDGKANITLIPESVQAVIHTLKRFIL